MKKVSNFILVLVTFMMACNNPSENAENQAKENTEEAVNDADKSVNDEAKSDMATEKSAMYTMAAGADEALAKVPMPKLTSNLSKGFAKSIGNHIVDCVNVKDAASATECKNKADKDLKEVENLTKKGKISKEDSKAISEYAANLKKAAGMEKM